MTKSITPGSKIKLCPISAEISSGMADELAELIEIKNDMATARADLAQAKKDGKEALILANTNLLAELLRKKNNLAAQGKFIILYFHLLSSLLVDYRNFVS